MQGTESINFIIHDFVGFTPNSRSHCHIGRNVQNECIGVTVVLFLFLKKEFFP
jgi:hypothetical protein